MPRLRASHAVRIGLFFCVWLVTPLLSAATDEWISLGPDGGVVTAFAIDPSDASTIYAATLVGGVFKSTDAGASWKVASVGLDSLQVNSLAIDPMSPSTLYAATTERGANPSGGIFKSFDGGANWQAINAGLEEGMRDKSVLSITIDPTRTSTLYALTEYTTYRSLDAGATWKELAGISGSTLVVDPGKPSTLYLGTGGGVFKSLDGGATWLTVNAGLGSLAVSALVIDSTSSEKLYAGTASGVFRTADGAASWSPANTGISGFTITTLALDPHDTSNVYAGALNGLFRSFDGGSSWGYFIALGHRSVTALALAATEPLTIYTGAEAEGVFKSADAGTSWNPSSAGLRALLVNALAIDPNRPSTILLSTSHQTTYGVAGLFRTTDAGENWQDISSSLPASSGSTPEVYALAIDPVNSSTVYAGSDVGAFKSLNGGVTWTAINEGLPATPPPYPPPNSLVPEVISLAVDPLSPQTVYIGIFRGIHVGGGVFKSLDGGATWSPSGLFGAVDSITIDPQKTSNLFCTGYSLSILSFADQSQDGGASWTGLSIEDQGIRAFAIDTRTSAVYAGGSSGIFKSVDNGRTWFSASIGLIPQDPGFSTPGIQSLAIDPGERPNIFAGSYGGGVFRSSTGGTNWLSMNFGLPNLLVNIVKEDPLNPAVLYAATNGNGLFRITMNPSPVARQPRVLPFR